MHPVFTDRLPAFSADFRHMTPVLTDSPPAFGGYLFLLLRIHRSESSITFSHCFEVKLIVTVAFCNTSEM
jgi:hypothetical protein